MGRGAWGLKVDRLEAGGVTRAESTGWEGGTVGTRPERRGKQWPDHSGPGGFVILNGVGPCSDLDSERLLAEVQ